MPRPVANRIRVDKKLLLSKLKANMAMHMKQFKDACSGYRSQAAKALDDRAEKLRRGETVNLHFYDLEKPVSYEKEYKLTIEMMEMSVDEQVEISSQEFQCYCNDDWDWKEVWSNSNAKYQG